MKKIRSSTTIKFGFGGILLFLFIWIGTTAFSTVQLLRGIKNTDVAAVARHSRYIKITTGIASTGTFHRSSTIETIDATLALFSKLDTLQASLIEITNSADIESVDFSQALTTTAQLKPEFTRLETHLSRCSLCNSLLYPRFNSQEIATFLAVSSAAADVAQELSTGTHRFLILFQNSDELRATGGFTGSYTVLTLIDGYLQPITIKDIYDADGQFTGFIPAPAGVQEYLSSNKGLRLPDANWAPHFPTSAKQIMQFFAFSDQENSDAVLVVTDSFFTDMLSLTGNVWLPDYQLLVTPENLTDVLRTNRKDFFAGSIQKKHLLEQFQNQLLIAISENISDPTILLTHFFGHIEKKNIQAYSSNDTLQTLFSSLSANGALFSKAADVQLAFVESNVGINKANKAVSRKMALQLAQTTLTAHYLLQNDNAPPRTTELLSLVDTPAEFKTASAEATHLGYINYQRVIYPASWDISAIKLSDGSTPQLHTEECLCTSTHALKETGFLVTVGEKSTTTVTISFTLPGPLTGQSLELYKQPGTEPFPVWISNQASEPFNSNPSLILEKNSVTIMP